MDNDTAGVDAPRDGPDSDCVWGIPNEPILMGMDIGVEKSNND